MTPISPAPGDIVFYDWQDSGKGDNRGFSDHVGIVVSVSGQNIKVIEGNLSNKVGYRTITANAKNIRGYGLPKFPEGNSTSEAEKAPTSPPVASEGVFCSVSLPQLNKGSKGSTVKAMQYVLIGSGYSCGSAGADGDFGSGTLEGLKRFQKINGLTIDGICGNKSWSKLLGV